MPRRERWSIIVDILDAIEREWRERGERPVVSNVAVRANLPYDRMRAYLQDLAALGLVTPDAMPQLTDRGRDLLRSAKSWREMLSRFGID